MGFATWMPDELRRMGARVEETSGWQRRGSSSFAPLGVVCHHTAAASRSDRPSLKLCIEGRSDLPGPLCNILLTRSGVAVLVAAGRANHAGSGSFRGVTGNSKMFGIEAENDGRGEPWPSVQLEAYERIVAGLLRGIGRDESWCCGHREWAPGRKIDPTFDMGGFRQAVASVMGGGPPVTDLASTIGTSGGLLGLGSDGPAVREWQEQLNRLGAALAVDGDFGPATLAATKSFQAQAGLSADGVVGPLTRQAMAEHLAAAGATTTSTTSASTTSAALPVLGRGDEGDAVRQWQEQLNRLGMGLAVDGDFGPATEQATKQFQASEGLDVDGLVGPRTRAAMARHLAPTG